MRLVRSAKSEWTGTRLLPGVVAVSDGPLIARPGRGSCVFWCRPRARVAAGVLFGPQASTEDILAAAAVMRERLGVLPADAGDMAYAALGAPGFPKQELAALFAEWGVGLRLLPVGQARGGGIVVIPAQSLVVLCDGGDAPAPAFHETPIVAGGGLDRFLAARPSLSTTATRFFRDAEVFRALRERVIPAWREGGSGALEMWNPGCSVGAETYSMAMTAAATFARLSLRQPHRTFGTDINPENIAIARQGQYPPPRRELFSPWEEAVFSRYMDARDSGVAAGAALRGVARFGLHDMRVPPKRHRFFFINCNHVLQYYETASQRAIVEALSQALEPGGFIYLHGSHDSALAGLPLTHQDGYRWLLRAS